MELCHIVEVELDCYVALYAVFSSQGQRCWPLYSVFGEADGCLAKEVIHPPSVFICMII